MLWPQGVASADEVPFDLMRAIEHASQIIDWQENLPKEDIPPEWMWPFIDELEIWFEEVDNRRKESSGGSSSSGDTTVPMMTNELARGSR